MRICWFREIDGSKLDVVVETPFQKDQGIVLALHEIPTDAIKWGSDAEDDVDEDEVASMVGRGFSVGAGDFVDWI